MVTTFKKYGVYHISQSEKIKQQTKETCLKKFGVEYSLQSERVKEKGKKTNLEKYLLLRSARYMIISGVLKCGLIGALISSQPRCVHQAGKKQLLFWTLDHISTGS